MWKSSRYSTQFLKKLRDNQKFPDLGALTAAIGNDVAAFYREFTALAGVEGVSKEAVKEAARENQPLLQRAVGALGEIGVLYEGLSSS